MITKDKQYSYDDAYKTDAIQIEDFKNGIANDVMNGKYDTRLDHPDALNGVGSYIATGDVTLMAWISRFGDSYTIDFRVCTTRYTESWLVKS